MKKGKATGPTICGICKRKKEVAIREQVEKGSSCGHVKCTFDIEIQQALQDKNKIKILPKIGPKYRIKILPPLKKKEDGKKS